VNAGVDVARRMAAVGTRPAFLWFESYQAASASL
jgi:hypothetical protein